MKPARGHPLAIAHRAGNELHLLRQAEEAGVDLVEADLWFWRGRIEVRHLKTMGPVPLLWDRWRLAPGWTPRLTLADLLQAAATETEFMFDLKGTNPLLPAVLLDIVHETRPSPGFSVCSQSWDLLEAFRELENVRVIHSIGSERQLREAWPRLSWHDRHAISIHRKLLNPATLRALKERAQMVMTWPINSASVLDEVVGLGVDGVISDNIDLLRVMVAARHIESAR
jgi:glycerophosphoryl diester phosphodiesterase